MTRLLFKLRALFQRAQLDADLRAELEHHQTMQGRRIGLGSSLYWQEEIRSQWTFISIEALLADLKTAARRLRRDRAFTAIAVLTVVLGVGATTAIFTLINGIALRPLPVPAPAQLVRFVLTHLPPTERHWVDGRPVPARERSSVSFPFYQVLTRHDSIFSGFFATAGTGDIHAEYNGIPRQVNFGVVTGSLFEVLGIQPQAGRFFNSSDDIEGGRAGTTWPAVISDRLWTSMFQRSPGAIGATITVDRAPFVIAAVCPPEFKGISPGIDRDLWIPLSSTESVFPLYKWRRQPGVGALRVFARLKPGVTPQQAARFIQGISATVLRETDDPGHNPEASRYWRAMQLETRSGQNGFTPLNSYLEPLTILIAAVAGVLLIAATNLTSLFLARAAARSHELAIRVSLGAPAHRLRRELLLESALIALAGVVAGYAFGQWLSRALQALGSSPTTAVNLDTSFDLHTFAFLAVTLLAVTFIAGLAPAWRAGAATAARLKNKSGSLRLRAALIILQTGLSLALIAGAGIMTASLRSLLAEDTGYDHEQSVFLWPDLFNAGISRERMPRAYQSIAARLRALPEIAGAGWTDLIPLAGGLRSTTIEIPGRDMPLAQRHVFLMNVGDGYLSGAGVALRAGADIEPQSANRPTFIVISESAALHFYGSIHNAIGSRLKLNNAFVQISGVASDAKYHNVREAHPLVIYAPYWLSQTRPGFSLALRYRGSRQTAIAAATRVFQEEAGRLPFLEVRTIQSSLSAAVSRERLLTWLLSSFALLALIISATGLAGLLSFMVEQRRRDFGIRLALGASVRHIRGLILKHSLLLTSAGLGFGALLSYLLRRSLDAYVFAITTADPRVWLGGGVLLLLAAVLAAVSPAWRAGRIDPAPMLRSQ
ncbi:MAG: ABC transporter permease [Acidobacteria bacterium]|nr:ABC transporter permease [Acidobacteriota bacterium]